MCATLEISTVLSERLSKTQPEPFDIHIFSRHKLEAVDRLPSQAYFGRYLNKHFALY